MKLLRIAFILVGAFSLQACGAATSVVTDVNHTQMVSSDPVVEAASTESTSMDSTEPEPVASSESTESSLASPETSPSDVVESVESQAMPSDTVPETITENSESSESTDEIPPHFVQCEVKIEQEDTLYQAQAMGPTLEEARDNAVEEACALPCAATLEAAGTAEEAMEDALETCAEECAERTIVVAAACHQSGKSIYTEGAWNEHGDGAPTNGEESQAAK